VCTPTHSKNRVFTLLLTFDSWAVITVIHAFKKKFATQPHLAVQMFCKNARTKLAMANTDPMPDGSATTTTAMAPSAAKVPPLSSSTSAGPQVTQSIQSIPLALLAAISKEEPQQQTSPQEARKFDFTGSSLQLLERQLQLLQEEQAQRLYMYRLAMAKSALTTATATGAGGQARPMVPPPSLPAQQQTAGIQRMQQFMHMRQQQRKGLMPTNGRASAA
jgi:hypothetical protein